MTDLPAMSSSSSAATLVCALRRLGKSTGEVQVETNLPKTINTEHRVQFKKARNQQKRPSRRRVQAPQRKAKKQQQQPAAAPETEVSVHEPGVIRGSWLTADVKSLLLKLIPCLREAGVLQRAISLDGPTARCLAAAAELGYAREDGLNTDEPVPSEAELAFRYGCSVAGLQAMDKRINALPSAEQLEGEQGNCQSS